MKRPARNLLYSALAFVCGALLLQGLGLELPKALGLLTAVAVGSSSPPPGEAATPAQNRAGPAGDAASFADLMRKACTASSSIETSFNSTPIAEGSTIWFNSAIRVDGPGANVTRIFLNDSRITFAANGSKYNLAAPTATITFDPAATEATATYLSGVDHWATMVPSGYSGKVFLSGLAFPVPAGGLPGGISSVTWSAAISTDTPGVTAEWEWGAAVYSTFATDYNAVGVKAAEDHANQGAKMLTARTDEIDSVGKPVNLEAFVIGGAGGEGGSNFTGSFRGSSYVTPCAEGTPAQARATSRMTIVMVRRGGAGTFEDTPIFAGLAITKMCWENLGLCLWRVWNLDPFNAVTNLGVTNEAPFPGGSPVAIPCYLCTDQFPCHPFGGAVTTLSPYGWTSDSCAGEIWENPPCGPSGGFFADRVTASGIDTNSGGDPIPVSASATNGVSIPACTPTPTFTPTPGNQGCSPGFWKQPQHFMFWGCGYAPNTLVSSIGLLTNTCGCDFSNLTMRQALSGSSGNSICDAQAKLYQMAVAALLNACSTVEYPLTTPQIVAEVNATLTSCSRDMILGEAGRLSGFNNGPGGCPLGGPGPYSTPSDTPTRTNTPTLTPTATRPEI